MGSSSRLPHLLNTHLSLPPQGSLILLTGVVNASTNWLLLRFLLSSELSGAVQQPPSSVEVSHSVSRIVLVSFLRDWEFWRDGARRIGLDVNQCARRGSFTFIDGLSGLFAPKTSANGRTKDPPGMLALQDPSLRSIEESITRRLNARSQGAAGGVMLLVDGLDALLAATPATALELLETVMNWRQHAYATVFAVSADHPLLLSPSTPLELNHAAFVAGLVQQTYFVMSLRLLSTGIAKDVSGVLRITRGAEAGELEAEESRLEEKELLYLVGGDGSVKIFERGAVD